MESSQTQSFIASTSGIKLKDKLGYALGDVASLLVFGLANTILQIYYTDFLGIAPLAIMLIFMIARIWDAFNDPLWGNIVDRVPSKKPGRRYRRWLLWLCVPLAAAAILLFLDVRALPYAAIVAYAAVTYLLFGMLYTGTNIPYGAMSSVITTNEKERNTLSIFRSVGSTLGGLGAVLLYSLCYTSVTDDSGTTTSEFNYTILMVGVVILAVLSIAAYIGCYAMSKERVQTVPRRRKKGETVKTMASLLKNRAFLTVSIVGLLFLAAQMFQTSYNTYLFKYYFGRPGLASMMTLAQYVPIAIVMFFSGALVRKFGRKEICAAGILLAAIGFLGLAIVQTTNVWIYLAFSVVIGFGSSFIFLLIWALANDAIDDYIVKNHKRDDGTAYSLFTFMRKLGQTLAALIVNLCLISMGYGSDGSSTINVTDSMASNMYQQAVIIPCVLCVLMFVILMFLYPLGKKKVAELQTEKEQVLREIQEESAETVPGEAAPADNADAAADKEPASGGPGDDSSGEDG